MFEDTFESTLKVEQGATSTELEASVKRLFYPFEEMKGGAPNNKVNSLYTVNSFLTYLIKGCFELDFLLLRVCL